MSQEKKSQDKDVMEVEEFFCPVCQGKLRPSERTKNSDYYECRECMIEICLDYWKIEDECEHDWDEYDESIDDMNACKMWKCMKCNAVLIRQYERVGEDKIYPDGM